MNDVLIAGKCIDFGMQNWSSAIGRSRLGVWNRSDAAVIETLRKDVSPIARPDAHGRDFRIIRSMRHEARSIAIEARSVMRQPAQAATRRSVKVEIAIDRT